MHNIFARNGPTTMPEMLADFDEKAGEFEKKSLYHLRHGAGKKALSFARGLVGPDAGPIASNPRARLGLARALWRKLKKVRQLDPSLEFRMVTLIFEDLMTSDEESEIELKRLIARSRRILIRMGGNFIAIVEFQVSNNVKHGNGGKILCPHCHAIMFGHRFADQAFKMAKEIIDRLGKLSNGMDPVHVTEACLDEASLRRAVFYPFKLPSKNKTLYLNPKTGRQNMHESTKGDRHIRYERMFELLSQVHLRELIFAGGEGKTIKGDLFRAAGIGSMQSVAKTGTLADDTQRFWKRWRQESETERFQPIKIIR